MLGCTSRARATMESDTATYPFPQPAPIAVGGFSASGIRHQASGIKHHVGSRRRV
eukprot:IDg15894t1